MLTTSTHKEKIRKIMIKTTIEANEKINRKENDMTRLEEVK